MPKGPAEVGAILWIDRRADLKMSVLSVEFARNGDIDISIHYDIIVQKLLKLLRKELLNQT